MAHTGIDERGASGPVERMLRVFLLLDCSGSMRYAGKMASLNNAMREILPALRDEASGRGNTEVVIRAMAFSDHARWIDDAPISSAVYQWKELVAGGRTSTGAALALLAEAMRPSEMPAKALPPVVILVSDGMATDDFRAGLSRLTSEAWGRRALRFSVAIGEDADQEELKSFLGRSQQTVLRAENPEQLLHQLEWSVVDQMRTPESSGLDG